MDKRVQSERTKERRFVIETSPVQSRTYLGITYQSSRKPTVPGSRLGFLMGFKAIVLCITAGEVRFAYFLMFLSVFAT